MEKYNYFVFSLFDHSRRRIKSTSLSLLCNRLIGNHPDELTPWIPVMAARSSPRCKFLLLPCCFFGFEGKFQAWTSLEGGRYRNYLDWVRTIVELCGFLPEEDCLRIPSTKKYCFVARQRNHLEKGREIVLERIQQHLEGTSGKFKPRPLFASKHLTNYRH